MTRAHNTPLDSVVRAAVGADPARLTQIAKLISSERTAEQIQWFIGQNPSVLEKLMKQEFELTPLATVQRKVFSDPVQHAFGLPGRFSINQFRCQEKTEMMEALVVDEKAIAKIAASTTDAVLSVVLVEERNILVEAANREIVDELPDSVDWEGHEATLLSLVAAELEKARCKSRSLYPIPSLFTKGMMKIFFIGKLALVVDWSEVTEKWLVLVWPQGECCRVGRTVVSRDPSE